MQGYVEGIFKTIPLNLQNHNSQKMVQKVESFRPSQSQASIHLWCSSSKSNNRPNALPLCAGVPPRPPGLPGRSQWGRRRWSWFWKAWKTSSLTRQPVLAASMANSCNFTKTWVFWSRNMQVEREWGGETRVLWLVYRFRFRSQLEREVRCRILGITMVIHHLPYKWSDHLRWTWLAPTHPTSCLVKVSLARDVMIRVRHPHNVELPISSQVRCQLHAHPLQGCMEVDLVFRGSSLHVYPHVACHEWSVSNHFTWFSIVISSHFTNHLKIPQNIPERSGCFMMLPPYFRPTSRYKSLPCQVIWGRRDRQVTPITVPWGDGSLVFNHRPPQNAQLRRWKIHPPKHFKWGFWCIYLHANQKNYPVLLGFILPLLMECPTGPTGHPFLPISPSISVDASEIRRSAVDMVNIPCFMTGFSYTTGGWLDFWTINSSIHSSISRLFSINSLGPILSMHRIRFTWPKNPGIDCDHGWFGRKNLEK